MAAGQQLRLLYAAQFLSLLASEVHSFALQTQMYQASASVARLGVLSGASAALPLVFAPLVGVLVDRARDVRVVMAAGDVAASVLHAAVLFGLGAGDHGLRHFALVCATVAAAAVAGSVQTPAFMAMVGRLVPREQLLKYAGLTQMMPALCMLVAPLIGGQLVAHGRLQWALAAETVTLLLSLACLRSMQLPPGGTDDGASDAPKSASFAAAAAGALARVRNDTAECWALIRGRPGLVMLLVLLAAGHFAASVIQTLATPLVLGMAGPETLGLVLTLSGLGGAVGAGLVSVFSRRIRPMRFVLLRSESTDWLFFFIIILFFFIYLFLCIAWAFKGRCWWRRGCWPRRGRCARVPLCT